VGVVAVLVDVGGEKEYQPTCHVRSTQSHGVGVSMHLEQILGLVLNKHHKTYLTHFFG